MNSITIHPAQKLEGAITVPGDKSVSHRAVMFGSLAEGENSVENLLLGEDVLSTMRIFQQLGVRMSHKPEDLSPSDTLVISGVGLDGLRPSDQILDCGNSGTTMRLLLGLLAAQPFTSRFTGDASLNRRPMERVIEPLKKMGAQFEVNHEASGRRIITVKGNKNLKGIDYTMPVASAQVKSAILLAGLYAKGETVVHEPAQSRDHTERMLKGLGAFFKSRKLTHSVRPGSKLKNFQMRVPGDFSSAAFFMVAGLVVPHSKLLIQNVGVNPTRDALMSVLEEMVVSKKGSKEKKLSLVDKREVSGEPVADIEVLSADLKAISIGGDIIPKLIDEIPVFSIAAARAKGDSVVADAKELRVKESDRIKTMCQHLKTLGVGVDEREDGFKVHGGKPFPFKAGKFQSFGDHRVAMSLAVAALVADGPSVIEDIDCVATSFPGFFDLLLKLSLKSV